jgi:hypothetical protein
MAAWGAPGGTADRGPFQDPADIYRQVFFWVWVAVMVAGQALLLGGRIRPGSERRRASRPVWVPVVVASFFFAILVLAAITAGMCAVLGDQALEIPLWWKRTPLRDLVQGPWVTAVETWFGEAGQFIWGAGAMLVAVWSISALVFRRWAGRLADPGDAGTLFSRVLFRGSVLELLIAVPSHVWVRQRGDCCAPAATFWGITMGLAIMLLSFGPGVAFLYRARCARLKRVPPNQAAPSPPAARSG